MFAFRSVAIGPFLADLLQIPYLTIENSRSRSSQRSNLMVTFEALRAIDMFAFCFMAIGPFFG